MEKSRQPEMAVEHSIRAEQASQPQGLTLEGLLLRMDGIRKEMTSMQELLATMEKIASQGGEDDTGHIAAAAGSAFEARERTLQQQLSFLERIYGDHFSASSGEERTKRTRMILDNMNDVIPALDYSDENGSAEALKVITALYSDLMKQA